MSRRSDQRTKVPLREEKSLWDRFCMFYHQVASSDSDLNPLHVKDRPSRMYIKTQVQFLGHHFKIALI